MIFGMDVSVYQGPNVDFHRARREGIEFAIIRSWDRRANAVDAHFHRNLRVAREAGMIVAAYHFIVPWEDGWLNTQHVLDNVPADVAIILDVELDSVTGRGTSIGLAQDVANRLRAAGRRLPLAYVPRWYWDGHLGRPDLRGLSDHGLWASRYVNNMGGSPASIYPHHFGDGWSAYGGAPVRILQFTDESTIAGQTPVDANAFLGSREELAALLGEDDMFSDSDREKLTHIQIQFTGNPWYTSSKNGPYHGWPDLYSGWRTTWTGYHQAIDKHLVDTLVAEQAQTAALEKLVDALDSEAGNFDQEAFLAEVKEASKARAAAELYKVRVAIRDLDAPADEEPEEA